MLAEDIDLVQHRGLDALSPAQKMRLDQRYRKHDSPCARELLDWLSGRYLFDPACLTD